MAETLRFAEVRVNRVGEDGRTSEILKGVDLACSTGELTALAGPSGCGKSTLLRLANRLEDPSSGTVLLGGRDVREYHPPLLRRRVGLMLQKPFMFEGSVEDNLRLPFAYGDPADPPAREAILELLELCQLPAELMNRQTRSLSIGQQQRVALARTLVVDPEVLLLDEPTSALDRPTADRLGEILVRICCGRRLSLILVSHDLRLVERIADRLVYMEAGRILEQGIARELLSRPRSAELRRFLAHPEPSPGAVS